MCPGSWYVYYKFEANYLKRVQVIGKLTYRVKADRVVMLIEYATYMHRKSTGSNLNVVCKEMREL